MAEEAQIKIVSFERHSMGPPVVSSPSKRQQISLNLIVFTPNKKLSFAENYIKEMDKEDLNLIRCNKISNLNNALNSCKPRIKTVCISDKEINEEVLKVLIDNQNLMKNKEWFTFCLFIQDVEKLHHQNFHTEGVDLITSDQQKIIQYIETLMAQNLKKLGSHISSSTINSKDEEEMKSKYNHELKHEIKNLPSHDQSYEGEQVLNDGIPGVGDYNLPSDSKGGKTSAVFMRAAQRSDPKNWNNSASYFDIKKG